MMDAAGLTGPTWDAHRSLVRAIYALPMSPIDLGRFRCHTGRQTPPPAPVKEAWLVVGRRGGKSKIASLAALYQAIRRDWRAVFPGGEKLVIPVLARDKYQATQILEYLKALLELHPFARWKWHDTQQRVSLRNDVTIQIMAASFRSMRGPTFLGVMLDEIAFWHSDERSANPDSEVLRALRPGLLTVPEGLIFGLSSPYAARGELYKAHQRFTGVDNPRGICWNADTLTMNPLADPQEIAQAFIDDPVDAASQYGQGGSVVFRLDIEGFLNWEAIRAVTAVGRRELPPQPGIVYYAFVDMSGGSGDSAGLAITHREQERVILDLVREIRAPHSPSAAVKEFAETVGPYGITYVTGDHYAGEWPGERFLAHGISYEISERPKSRLYVEMLPLVNAARCELLDLPRLGAQLVGLERRVSRGGKDSIDHQPGGHDDVANAAAGALVLAAEGLSSERHDPADDDPHVTWRDGLQFEYEKRRSRPHPNFQQKQRNLPTDLS